MCFRSRTTTISREISSEKEFDVVEDQISQDEFSTVVEILPPKAIRYRRRTRKRQNNYVPYSLGSSNRTTLSPQRLQTPSRIRHASSSGTLRVPFFLLTAIDIIFMIRSFLSKQIFYEKLKTKPTFDQEPSSHLFLYLPA